MKHLKCLQHLAFFCSWPLFFLQNALFAQTTTAPKYAVSYTETIKTVYEINNSDQSAILPVELAGMLPSEETRAVLITVDQSNDIATTVNILSSNASEPWMNPPKRIVTNKNGTQTFDKNNQLLEHATMTPEMTANYQEMKIKIAENGIQQRSMFRPLTIANISALQQAGYVVETLSNGSVKVKNNAVEIIYDFANLSLTISQLENLQPIHQIIHKYRVENNRTIPASKVERTYEITPSGKCYSMVTTTTYNNYNQTGLP